MRKKVVVPSIIVTLAIALYVLSLPTQPEPEIAPDPLSTELYLTLASAGIHDAVVDVTEERALIRYNLPENVSKESVNYYIIGATAAIANSSRIVIQVYDNFTPLEEVEVSRDDVLAFMNHDITYEEFKGRINVRSLT